MKHLALGVLALTLLLPLSASALDGAAVPVVANACQLDVSAFPGPSVQPATGSLDELFGSVLAPMAWNPPPTECIPGLACSIPQDCPGGECHLFGIYNPWDRRCICEPLIP